nr:PREDICTED: calcium/calmodulin-dependent 3',5'-cyclic nucleotide phosphodiesterase 1C-like [Paralichthys olivaceus]
MPLCLISGQRKDLIGLYSRKKRLLRLASPLSEFDSNGRLKTRSSIANEVGEDTRCPLARFARSWSQNALCTTIRAGNDITDHKGILISPRSAEEILADELPFPDAPDAMEKTALRLRCLVKQLERGEASVVDLKKNLEYAASVLEHVYNEETRQGAFSSVLFYIKPYTNQYSKKGCLVIL